MKESIVRKKSYALALRMIKPVAYEEIPQFTERATTIGERLAETMKYLAIMLAYMGVMFFVTIIKFERYDVR